MNRLDNILEPNFEERGLQRPTSVARHVMSTTPKKCFDQELSCIITKLITGLILQRVHTKKLIQYES